MSQAERHHTVLFVDDDADLTRGVALALRRERFRTLTANSAEEALETLEKESVDVIVSDDQMPRMCGAELLSHVRAERPDVVRILLTGQTDIRRAATAINDAGVFRFLLKPYDRSLLVETLGAAFATVDAAARAPRPADARAFEAALAELWLAHQPLFDRRGSVVGYELLMRSASAEFRGPEHLLTAARLLSRGVELDRCIGGRAVFAAEALGNRLVFVNVDPPSLSREDLFEPLASHAEHVVLEITERDAWKDTPHAIARIGALKERGFRIAIDDLGSGHSGLSSVVELAPDIIKLDMGLVRDLDRSFVKRRLVRSMCEAARDLGIHIVAEGIERLEELDATFDAGCDYFQGYLLGRPTREPVVTAWPLEHRTCSVP
ncbi:MAG: EAL domain-containing protein [Polyangiaceae bacterium]